MVISVKILFFFPFFCDIFCLVLDLSAGNKDGLQPVLIVPLNLSIIMKKIVIVVILVVFGFLSLSTHAAPINNAQLEVLQQILHEVPSLALHSDKPWSENALEQLCNTTEIYGVSMDDCDADGWITKLEMSTNSLNPFGNFPPSLGNMTHLKTLTIGGNSFVGTLPTFWSNLELLESLTFTTLTITSPIPNEWSTFIKLKSFVITGLRSGSSAIIIPDWMEHCTNLTEINLGRNTPNNVNVGSIPSSIPSSLPNLVKFSIFNIGYNGTIPSGFANHPKLKYLSLQNNKFSGEIPSDWSGAISLTDILFQSNQLIGPLPTFYPPNLINLNLVTNKLNGTIPQSLLDHHVVSTIDLNSNQLTGNAAFPNISNSKLFYYRIFNNPDLTGSIETGAFSITTLDVTNTGLNGTFPSNVPTNCKLTRFFADDAQLEGSLPARLDFCSQLNSFSASNNRLSGSLPEAISNMTRLQIFNLKGNQLTDKLPNSWNNLILLHELDLSENQLNGTIPLSLVDSNLRMLNLSNNQFDLCGNPNLNSRSVFSLIDPCDVSEQSSTPIDCGCLAIWKRCLPQEMSDMCAPAPGSSDAPINSPTSEAGGMKTTNLFKHLIVCCIVLFSFIA
jgi:hypothetical protein